MSVARAARLLNYYLGTTLVATLAGTKDRQAPWRWVGGTTTPTPDEKERLLTAHRVWHLITDAEGEDVARAWFVGANPDLGDVSPALAIRDGRFDDVEAAAAAFAGAEPHVPEEVQP